MKPRTLLLPPIAAATFLVLLVWTGSAVGADFFSLCTTTACATRSFYPIPVTNYPASFFQNYYATHSATPTGPDTD
jgi:hypothetical protein